MVGNEVLLRGEMTTSDLAANIRAVKPQVTVPVTYADVWEFWLRNREIYDAVDFVTIHILPYWEDMPVRAKFAASHVDSIRKRMAVAFPGKEILIGETGWPSAGRMREGALPSRTNQARVVSEILDLAKREGFRVNLIEAYDQPWKRQLEGTVGGYWGLIDAAQRAVKYPPGEAISNFPFWKLQMGCGMALSFFVFLAGWLTLRRRPWQPRLAAWLAVGTSATISGMLLGVAADKMFYESYGTGGWLQWGALLAAAIASPMLCANAAMSGRPLPTFLELLGPRDGRTGSVLSVLLGLTLVVATVIGAETALGFAFDPRYRDFPFASLTMAVVPFAALMLVNRPKEGTRPIAEIGLCRTARGGHALYRRSTKARRTGRRCGPARSTSCSRLRCGGRGPRKSQNKQPDREPRQHDIIEHDPEPGCDQPAGQQHDRRPHHVQHRDDQGDDAEHRILEQGGGERAGLADHRLQAGVARQRDGRELDREIAQIQRVADGEEADHQQELHLIGRQPERSFFHSGIFSGLDGWRGEYGREWPPGQATTGH